MKQPSINISRLHPLPGCKPVKALAILCVLLFVALSVHATVVPDKYLTTKYLRYDASAKTYYWEVGCATSANDDFPEVLEFPTRLVYENDKKSYAIREVSIILKEKTKKVIFHSGLTKTFISYERNSPIESIEYLGANTIANIYLKNCKTIKEATLPKTLLWDGFINCTALEKVTFLEGCAEIPSLWFSSCSALKTIVWPSTMKKIGDAAFEYAGLETLTLPEGFNSLGERCLKNSKLVNVVLPNSLTEIPREAFYNCSALKKVTLPSSLTDIPDKLFYACDVLNDIVIPTSVKTMGRGVFSGCKALERMTIGDGVTIGNNLFSDCESLKEVKLPATLTTIPEYTFNKCVSLKKVEFPTGLMSIERYAFEGSGIEEVVVPETVTKIAGSFANCKSLKRFVFPKNLEAIENSMFRNCELLADITLPTNVKTIGSYAFAGTLFDKSELPATVNSLGYNAFENCKQLKEMFIPEGVTSIPEELFMSCTSLTRVVLPSTVNQFYGGNTFKDCPLTDIVCHAPTAPEAENYVFDAKHYSSTRLIVPEGSNYNDKYPWSRFNQKTEGEGFITLNNPVFSKESCTYTEPITVTITNPNASGTLYYKLVPEGTAKDEVEYTVFTEPLKLSEQSATIYAYIVDGINSSEYARMTYTYEPPVVKKVVLYVCGRLVDEKNAYDIFGDKTVSYDPKSEVLTLTWANIDATKFKASNIISGSGGDLTIRVVGHCTLKAPGTPIMYGHQLGVPGGSNLTIVGDENSILTVETTNEEKGGYSCGIDMYCGNLTIDNCTVVATGGTHGLYTKTGPEEGLTMRGEHALLNLTGTESAMDNVQRLDLDKMLMILEPEGAEFWDGSIWLGKEKQTHVVIGAPRTDDNVEVPEIREEYQTNFSSDLTDQKTGEALNVENVVINNVYYNLPAANNDGFDAKEQCLILNTSMDYYTMNKRIPADATVTADFGSWYNGLIIVVNGKGTIDIDYQTEGGSQLAVKIGEEEAKYYTADMQGRVQVPYDVATPQYVYIYNSQYTGDEKKAPARARAMAGKSWLKIYGMKITPQEPTGIHNIFVDSEGQPVTVYDMNGRKVNNPGKGVYIVNGKKIMKRQ